MLQKRGLQQTVLNVLGLIVACVGVYYVVLKLREYSGEIELTHIGMVGWVLIGLCVVVYTVINLLMAYSWSNLLKYFGERVPFRWAIKVFGLSQIGKYVPGNIFHLAGRQMLGMSRGIPGSVLAKSLLWELALLAVAGCLFVLLVVPLFFPAISDSISITFFVASLFIATIVSRMLLASEVSEAIFCYVLFLAMTGLLFTALLAIVSIDMPGYSVLVISASFVVAWLIGFLTPGAPAGIGVRELALLFLLGNTVNQSDLLLAIVVSRAMSASGDLLYFLCATWMPDHSQFTAQ